MSKKWEKVVVTDSGITVDVLKDAIALCLTKVGTVYEKELCPFCQPDGNCGREWCPYTEEKNESKN